MILWKLLSTCQLLYIYKILFLKNNEIFHSFHHDQTLWLNYIYSDKYYLLKTFYNLHFHASGAFTLIPSGSGWKLINGFSEGQTQDCCDVYTGVPIWDHPLDLHYTTRTLHGSPKLLVQLFSRDKHKRILFIGYGIVAIPLTPGSHHLKCHTWRPVGGWQDRLKERFLGITLQLKSPNLLVDSNDRFELLTESMGSINVHIDIITKKFDKYGCRL